MNLRKLKLKFLLDDKILLLFPFLHRSKLCWRQSKLSSNVLHYDLCVQEIWRWRLWRWQMHLLQILIGRRDHHRNQYRVQHIGLNWSSELNRILGIYIKDLKYPQLVSPVYQRINEPIIKFCVLMCQFM